MKVVIDIDENLYTRLFDNGNIDAVDMLKACAAIRKGTPLPKGHSFIAICDSDYPITEEVRQELKNTVFVGNEDCHYCFDMTEIIETESERNE